MIASSEKPFLQLLRGGTCEEEADTANLKACYSCCLKYCLPWKRFYTCLAYKSVVLLIVPCYHELPFCLNTRSCRSHVGIIMGSHVSIEYTLSMIQAFIGKGHSTDRIRLIIAKNDLFSSCRNTYISVKYSYSSPQQSVSAGTIKSSCASSQPEKQRSTSV